MLKNSSKIGVKGPIRTEGEIQSETDTELYDSKFVYGVDD